MDIYLKTRFYLVLFFSFSSNFLGQEEKTESTIGFLKQKKKNKLRKRERKPGQKNKISNTSLKDNEQHVRTCYYQ